MLPPQVSKAWREPREDLPAARREELPRLRWRRSWCSPNGDSDRAARGVDDLSDVSEPITDASGLLGNQSEGAHHFAGMPIVIGLTLGRLERTPELIGDVAQPRIIGELTKKSLDRGRKSDHRIILKVFPTNDPGSSMRRIAVGSAEETAAHKGPCLKPLFVMPTSPG
jgi:hypothetical protein